MHRECRSRVAHPCGLTGLGSGAIALGSAVCFRPREEVEQAGPLSDGRRDQEILVGEYGTAMPDTDQIRCPTSPQRLKLNPGR